MFVEYHNSNHHNMLSCESFSTSPPPPEIEIDKTPLPHPQTGLRYTLTHESPLNLNLHQRYPPTKRSRARRSLRLTVLR